jgi:hypothetical protein
MGFPAAIRSFSRVSGDRIQPGAVSAPGSHTKHRRKAPFGAAERDRPTIPLIESSQHSSGQVEMQLPIHSDAGSIGHVADAASVGKVTGRRNATVNRLLKV